MGPDARAKGQGLLPDALLGNANCRRLLALVQETPGQNIQELSAAAGVTRTAANYHVRRLIKAGYLVPLRQGPHLLHFPTDIPPNQRIALGLLRIPSIRAIVLGCYRDAHASWRDLAARLHVTPRTVRRGIHVLRRHGLMQLVREGEAKAVAVHLHPDLRHAVARLLLPEEEAAQATGVLPGQDAS
ncbi:MAG TPA: winged helix-turn-helix transcriptional regulator [Candidatus Thermoplasmatota archaeon]|nr:winged helix-turn-helix transcriptional regulator [Candidatus Thermoplasmatota archaeon]